jgi:O-antigen/teichoic acid export membrane protein
MNYGGLVKISDARLIVLGQVAAGIFSLISVTFCAKYLGPEAFGFCSVLLIILNIGMGIFDFGACSWAARELASKSISVATFRFIMNSKTRINFIFLALAPILYFFAPYEYRFSYILVLYPILWNRFNFVQQYLLVSNKIEKSIFLVMLERFIWLLVIPFSILKLDPMLVYSLPILIGQFVHNLIGTSLLKTDHYSSLSLQKYSQITIFKHSKHFGLITMSGVFSTFDSILVASVTSLTESANYIFSQRFRNPLAIIFTSVAHRMKVIASTRNANHIQVAFRADANLLVLGLLLSIFFSISLLYYSEKILGASFEGIGLIMFFGSLTSVPFGITVLSTNLLSAIGKEKFVSSSSAIYTFVMLLSVILAASFYGSLGATIDVFLIVSIYALITSLKLKKELMQLI